MSRGIIYIEERQYEDDLRQFAVHLQSLRHATRSETKIWHVERSLEYLEKLQAYLEVEERDERPIISILEQALRDKQLILPSPPPPGENAGIHQSDYLHELFDAVQEMLKRALYRANMEDIIQLWSVLIEHEIEAFVIRLVNDFFEARPVPNPRPD